MFYESSKQFFFFKKEIGYNRAQIPETQDDVTYSLGIQVGWYKKDLAVNISRIQSKTSEEIIRQKLKYYVNTIV